MELNTLTNEQKQEIERLYLEEGLDVIEIKKKLGIRSKSFNIINFLKSKEKDWTFKERKVFKYRDTRCSVCQRCTHKSDMPYWAFPVLKEVYKNNEQKKVLSHEYSKDVERRCLLCYEHNATQDIVSQEDKKLYDFEYYE